MFITKVTSYLGGWDLLINQKSSEMHEIDSVLSQLATEKLRTAYKEWYGYERIGRYLDVSYVQLIGDELFESCGWNKRVLNTHSGEGSGVYAMRWKNGISLRFLVCESVESANFMKWFMFTRARAQTLNACDVVVLLVPVDELVAILDNDNPDRSKASYERCIAQLSDLLPLRHHAPFVIIGFSQYRRAPGVDEIAVFDQSEPEDRGVVEKSIEFPQEYYQAGVSILSYFGEVLKQKHPDIAAKVRIEQDGLTVRLRIESGSGDTEIVEKTLEEYGLVIAEQLPPEAMFENRLQVVALEQKLELAKAEIRYTQQLLALAEGAYQQRIGDLQNEVTHLRTYIGRHLSQIDVTQALLARQSETNERLLLAQVVQADSLIQNLIRQSADNNSVRDALTIIDQKLTEGVKFTDEEAVKRALAIIRQEKPSVFTQLHSIFLNLSYEVSGGFLFKWIEALTRQV